MTLYPVFTGLLALLMGPTHVATFRAISVVIWALLLSQSLHVADLGRALPELKATHARQGMRRVRRVLDRSPLMSVCLTPHLVRLVLRLVGDNPISLVLDSTRCLCWEIFTLGIGFHGRVLPVAWSVLPYPWPKNRFTPTVVALLERTLVCWPNERPIHLLADRGFPSLKLFACLEAWRQRLPLGYTIRLRAGDWVHLADGRDLRLADLLKLLAITSSDEGWTSHSASYRHRGKHTPPALLVIGRSQSEYPAHQRGPADEARRLARAKRRLTHLASKVPSGHTQTADTDRVWMLLTTSRTIEEARAFYGLRFHTEGTYRDLKAWDLEAVAGHETDQRHLDGLFGLAVLSYFIQAAIGAVAGCARDAAQARQRQWCTTDRLSVFWRGRQVLHDRAYDWRPWLKMSLSDLTHQLASTGSTTNSERSPTPTTLSKEAA